MDELLEQFDYDLYRLEQPLDQSDEESDEEVDQAEEERRIVERRERYHLLDNVYLFRADVMDHFDDAKLYNTFRFDRESINYITEIVNYKVERPTDRKRALSSLVQVLLALQFFATGVFQACVGNVLHVSQSSVCRSVHDVSLALCEQAHRFIKLTPDMFRRVRAVRLA